jgi:hypothetical protein
LSNSNAGTGPEDLDGDAGDPTVKGVTAPITDLSVSTFNVTGLVGNGANTIQVLVDPTNWVNEIDTASLTGVPEPGTLSMLGAGLALLGLAMLRRRRQNALSTC